MHHGPAIAPRRLPEQGLEGFRAVHLIGIAGVGMRALAKALLARGIAVSGSDTCAPAKYQDLVEAGVRVHPTHDAAAIGDPCAVVYSSAIPSENPELRAARERGIPVLHRSALLGRFLSERRTLLVAGTHGKTTVTALLGLLFEAAAQDPWVFVGGHVPEFGGYVRGGGMTWCVAEADESDGTFLDLPGEFAIITNIEADHLNHWGTEEKFFEGFVVFAARFAPGKVALCLDDPGAARLAAAMPGHFITYGIANPAAEFRATDLELNARGSRFALYRGDALLGTMGVGIPGVHNVLNALGSLALATAAGLEPRTLRDALTGFRGVGRRFTCRELTTGVLVVDDYAHHSTEIAVTIASAQPLKESRRGRLIVVFQPHRASRAIHLRDCFPHSFSGSDYLIVTDIYLAGENAVPGLDGRILAREIAVANGFPVEHVADARAAAVRAHAASRPGDVILFLGAGSITDAARHLVETIGATNP